jgi:hypothetical protein
MEFCYALSMITNVFRFAALGMFFGPPVTVTPAHQCPKTWAEAGELFATMERLKGEANGEWSPNGD